MGRILLLVAFLLVCHQVEFTLMVSSVVRRVLAQSGLSLNDQLPSSYVTIAEALMAPAVIYVRQVLDLISKGGVKGIAHIAGSGFTENIPECFRKAWVLLCTRTHGKCLLCSSGFRRWDRTKGVPIQGACNNH